MLKILRDLSTFLQTLCHNGEADKAVYIQHLGCLYQIDRTEIVKNCFGENICLIKTDNNIAQCNVIQDINGKFCCHGDKVRRLIDGYVCTLLWDKETCKFVLIDREGTVWDYSKDFPFEKVE